MIYINDIPEGIKLICKIIADDTLLFSIVKKDKLSQYNLNSDLKKVSEWVHQWKTLFEIPITATKQQRLILKKKQNKDSILLLRFNDNAVQTEEVQAHLVFH